jgi:uncharacterized membrane protein
MYNAGMTISRPTRPAAWDAAAALLALAALLVVLFGPPHGILDKADRAAFAVCHRIPERTFFVAGRPLPLCARCSGTYLGALAGLLILAARGRGAASRFPAWPVLAVLAFFVLAWAVDGMNSFLSFFPGLPYLYEPSNRLRLVTGTLEGLALAAVLVPVLNLAFWAAPADRRSIGSWADLAWMLVGGAVVVALVNSEWPALLYPLAVISGLTIVALLGLVNAMLAVIVMRREARIVRRGQVIAPVLLGMVLALVELAAIAFVRDALTARFGLPF